MLNCQERTSCSVLSIESWSWLLPHATNGSRRPPTELKRRRPMQTGKHGVRTYGQASIGIPPVPETPETKRRPLQAAYAQRPKESPGPSDVREPEGQPP